MSGGSQYPYSQAPIAAYPARPGILTAIAVASIVLASIGLLVNFVGLLFANQVSRFAAHRVTAAQTVANTPPPPAPASGEFVAQDGLSANQRQIVIQGLSQVRPLSDARQQQLEGLLADAGRKVIRLSPDNLTSDRIAAYVTDERDMPDASGGAPDDLFTLGSGRLQISDHSAVFFPENSPSGIRSQGGSYTDAAGTHLASMQINAVVDRVQSLCNQAMNSAQVNSLEGELQMPGQTLITPSLSVAQAAGQVQSAQLYGQTVVVTTDHGTMSLGPNGESQMGWVNFSAQQAMWRMPTVARTDATLLMLETMVSFLASGFLLVSGIVLLRFSPWGRWLHLGYAVGKIGLGVLSCYAIYTVAMQLNATAADASATAMAWMLIVGATELVYPVILLIVMNLSSVRQFLAVQTVGRIY
jgi:hypothetical protein